MPDVETWATYYDYSSAYLLLRDVLLWKCSCSFFTEEIAVIVHHYQDIFCRVCDWDWFACFRREVCSVLTLKNVSPLIRCAIHFRNGNAFNLLLISCGDHWVIPSQVQLVSSHCLCILGLFWYLLLYLFTIYDNKIELCFSQTIALKSWSCLELFLFLQRSAEEFLWLLVKVALYCLSGKDFCLLSRMAYNHL